jgi:hypothetical protein
VEGVFAPLKGQHPVPGGIFAIQRKEAPLISRKSLVT